MGFLTHGKPVRLEMGDNFWVDLRPGLSHGDLDAAQNYLSQYRIEDGDKVVAAPNVSGYQREMVGRSIISWNLTDENDGLLPISPSDVRTASLRRLPQWAFNKIYARVAELNNERTPVEEATFPATGEAGDNGEGQGTGGSAGPA